MDTMEEVGNVGNQVWMLVDAISKGDRTRVNELLISISEANNSGHVLPVFPQECSIGSSQNYVVQLLK